MTQGEELFNAICSLRVDGGLSGVPNQKWNDCRVFIRRCKGTIILEYQRITSVMPVSYDLRKKKIKSVRLYDKVNPPRLQLEFPDGCNIALRHNLPSLKKIEAAVNELRADMSGAGLKPKNSYSGRQTLLNFAPSTSPSKTTPLNQETPTQCNSIKKDILSPGRMDDHDYCEKENGSPNIKEKHFQSAMKKSFYATSGALTEPRNIPRSYGPFSFKSCEAKKRVEKSSTIEKSKPLSINNSWNKPSSSKTSATSSSKTPLQGFSNLGNTCYMNSILQSLLSLSPFTRDMNDLANEVKTDINFEDQDKLLFIAVSKLLKMNLMTIFTSERKRKILEVIKKVVSSSAKRFSGYDQHDAHEFLCQMLDQIKEESSDVLKSLEEKEPKTDSGDSEHSQYNNPISSNFEFEVLHTIKCIDCDHNVKKVEIYNDMSVDLPHRKDMFCKRSLQDAISQFFKKETIERNCEMCDGKEAVYEHTIARLPRIIVIHLKRYKFQSASYAKIGQEIEIPKYLTFQAHCTDETLSSPTAPEPFCPTHEAKSPSSHYIDTVSPKPERKSNLRNPSKVLAKPVTEVKPTVKRTHGDVEEEDTDTSPKRKPMISCESEDDAFLSIPTFRNVPNHQDDLEPGEIVHRALEHVENKYTGANVPAVNYDEFTMKDMTEEEQMRLAMEMSMKDAGCPEPSYHDTNAYQSIEDEANAYQGMDQGTNTYQNLNQGGHVYQSTEQDANTSHEPMELENSDELAPDMDNLAAWSAAVAQSVDGTWDTDTDDIAPGEPNRSPRLFEDIENSPKKAFNSMDHNAVTTSTPDKISKTTNSKLQSLLTQRGADNEQPTLSDPTEFNNNDDFSNLVPREGSAEAAIDLTSDKENTTPPALPSPTMTYEERVKKEEEDLKRAIEESLRDQEAKLNEEAALVFEESIESNADEQEAEEELSDAEKQYAEKVRRNVNIGEMPHSYQLMSVVSHIGRTSVVGHYISDIYSIEKGKWTSCDDSEITEISEDIVRSQRKRTGYIFFYMNKNHVGELESFYRNKALEEQEDEHLPRPHSR